MKKFINTLLSVILTLTFCNVVTYAADATVTISRISASPGDKAEVFFSLECPDGIKTLSFLDFAYDSSALSIVADECEWIADGLIKDIDLKNNASIITFSDNTPCSGNMLKLVFTVSDSAKADSLPVRCNAIGTRMIDGKETKINITVSEGEILVNKSGKTESNAPVGKECNHDYKSVVSTPANCKNKGLMTYICSLCNDSYTQEIPLSQTHSFGNWTVIKKPTITANGTEERKCSVCGKKESRSTDKLPYLPGDINSDGILLASDARTILRAAEKSEKLSDEQFTIADINSDGSVTATDARITLRISAKLDSISNYKK